MASEIKIQLYLRMIFRNLNAKFGDYSFYNG